MIKEVGAAALALVFVASFASAEGFVEGDTVTDGGFPDDNSGFVQVGEPVVTNEESSTTLDKDAGVLTKTTTKTTETTGTKTTRGTTITNTFEGTETTTSTKNVKGLQK